MAKIMLDNNGRWMVRGRVRHEGYKMLQYCSCAIIAATVGLKAVKVESI
jgi:hypothetical protein